MMKKSVVYTYGILILLTLTTAFVANSNLFSRLSGVLIMGIAAIKFLLVAFQFMDLKIANSFWKSLVAIVLSILVLLIILVY